MNHELNCDVYIELYELRLSIFVFEPISLPRVSRNVTGEGINLMN